MNEQSEVNKKAWEYRTYEFRLKKHGTPEENAQNMMKDPLSRMRMHKKYFENVTGLRIANICGSCGQRAIPLALLGAEVTIYDISQENMKYALETAKYANTHIDYILGDFNDVDLTIYCGYYDILYMEGGILHYFKDIDRLTELFYTLLKPGGTLILSDFHPARRLVGKGSYQAGSTKADKEWTEVNYFDTGIHFGDVTYKSFFPEEEQQEFPPVQLRMYNLSEIINSVLDAGFIMKSFEEHPDWSNPYIPGEFTIFAKKPKDASIYIGKQDNVSIRLATIQDAELLCDWWNDGKVMAHAGFPKGLGTTVSEVLEIIKNNDSNNKIFILEYASTAIGEMNYRIYDNTAEIGIKICDLSYQEKGIGTKALNLLIKYLFQKLNVDKIILDTNLKNTRAQHIYEKLGFTKLRVNYESWKDQMGEFQSSVDYELTKENYTKHL